MQAQILTSITDAPHATAEEIGKFLDRADKILAERAQTNAAAYFGPMVKEAWALTMRPAVTKSRTR